MNFFLQHAWSSSIRTFIDLEAIGVGGKSTLFQVHATIQSYIGFFAPLYCLSKRFRVSSSCERLGFFLRGRIRFVRVMVLGFFFHISV